jgi:hypothetical protein
VESDGLCWYHSEDLTRIRIVVCKVELAISTHVDALVENAAPNSFFFYGSFFVSNFLGGGSVRLGCHCACGWLGNQASGDVSLISAGIVVSSQLTP